MAGLQFSSGIDKGFEKDLNRMNKQMNGFTGNVQKQGGLINNSFKQIGQTIGGIASVAALAQAGKSIITFSSDLQTSLTEVSTISQEVTDNFSEYKDAILDISKSSSSGAKEISDAFYDIVSAGYDGAAGLDLLTAAERASTAGFVDVGIAADGLTTVLNAWGKSADEAGKVSDVFFKTVEKGKTTFPELGANIAQVAPLAASLGVSFEEVQAAVATITKSGVPTSQAFTQIRSALVGMNESLGDGWAQTMTLQEGFQEIYKQANGSATGVQALVGRVEGMNAVLALSGKNAKVAASDLDAMTKSLGATESAALKVEKIASQQSKILVNNILAALEPLGTAAVETFATLASSINEAFKSGDVEKYAKVLGTLIAAFAAWKISLSTTAIYNRTLGKEAVASEQAQQAAKLKSIEIEIAKQRELIATAAIVGRNAKVEILAIQQKLQVERQALSQAIANKDLTAARSAQQKISNLENQKAAAIITKKTATETAASSATKINTLQTNLNTAATKSSTVATRAFSLASNKLGGAFKSLKAAFASNPIGILVTGLTLAIPLITSFVNSQNELSKTTAKLNTEIQKEQSETNKLFDALKKTNPKSEERTKIVQQLNDKYPDLLKNYNLDVAGLNDIEKAQDLVNKKIIETIALRSQEERIQKAAQSLYDNQTTILQTYLQNLSSVADKGSLSIAFSQINTELQKEGSNTIKIAEDLANKLGIAIEKGSETTIIQQGTPGATTAVGYQASKYELLLSTVNKLSLANKDYLKTQKEIEDFTKAFLGGDISNKTSIKTPEQIALEEADKARLKAEELAKIKSIEDEKQRKLDLAALEIDNQNRINKITENYGGEEALEKEFNKKMLQNRLIYLDELSKLTPRFVFKKEEKERQDDALKIKQIEEEIINTTIAINKLGVDRKIEILDLNYKKEILLLKNKYKDHKKYEKQFNKESLEAEKKYLKEKLNITSDENKKVEIETRLKDIEYIIAESEKSEADGQKKRIDLIKEANDKILELNKKLQGDITVAQAKEIKKQIQEQENYINSVSIGTKTQNKIDDQSLNQSVELLGSTLSKATDDLTNSLGSLVSGISNAFETLSDKGSSQFSKVSGVVSLALSFGKQLASIRDEAYKKEIEDHRNILNNLNEQISIERTINDIRQERIDRDLQSNVFQDTFYIDEATNAVQKQQKAYEELNDSLNVLSSNAIITGTGTAKRRLFGSKTVNADFSIEQILSDYVTQFAGSEIFNSIINPLGGNIEAFKKGDFLSQLQSFLDPAGIFGGYASGKATSKALEDVKDVFNSTLTSMGKTSADIANLSTEEWLDFFTILDEAGKIQDEATKQLLSNAQESMQEYEAAMDELESVISDVAGGIGNSLADSIVNAIATGEDALINFSKTFDDVLLEMAKSTANQIFFKDLFDTLQEEMKASVTDGDNKWQDDLLRFYDELPSAISGAQDFLTDFDSQLQDLGFEGITGSTDSSSSTSRAGQIQQAITEETGSELVGRMGAIMMSNQIIANNSTDMLDYAVQNLVTLNKIKENTDYLPEIATNTKKMADGLTGL